MNTVTLNELKKAPDLKQAWVGKKVFIWSDEHNAYWRPNGCGHTVRISAAGTYDFEDAFRRTSHCGPEKQIEYELAGG